MKINSHNEWDKLKEVIVGTAEGTTATLSWMRPEPISEKIMEKALELSKKASPKWFYDEVEEDLEKVLEVTANFESLVIILYKFLSITVFMDFLSYFSMFFVF